MVSEYLTTNKYDGLFNNNSECGCDLEDLMPCDEPCDDCEAGYKHKCPEGHESDWLMTRTKEPPNFDE